jgi:hypothetical protein
MFTDRSESLSVQSTAAAIRHLLLLIVHGALLLLLLLKHDVLPGMMQLPVRQCSDHLLRLMRSLSLLHLCCCLDTMIWCC